MILHILAPTFLASLMSFHSSSCCNHRDEYSKPLTLYTQIKLWFSFCYTLHLQYFRRFLPMSQIFTHASLSSIGPSQISLGESIETMICVVLYYIYWLSLYFLLEDCELLGYCKMGTIFSLLGSTNAQCKCLVCNRHWVTASLNWIEVQWEAD